MKNNRLGLLLIVSALAVIALVILILYARQQEVHTYQIRAQGVGITRSLSALPLDILAPSAQRSSILQSLLAYHENPYFGYGAVTALNGRILAQVTAPGVITPTTPIPTGTTSLFGEREVEAPNQSRRIREFYAPVMEDGNLSAFIRIGYYEKPNMVGGEDLSFLALIALPMFLLVPFVYFLLQRELKPLTDISQQLQSLLHSTDLSELKPDRLNVRGFAEKVYLYVQNAHLRIAELEQEKAAAVTTTRLLEYSSNKIATVLHALPDALLIMDPAGHVTFASAKTEALLGTLLEPVLTEAPDNWCSDPELAMLLNSFRETASRSLHDHSVQFRPAGAPERVIRAAAHPLLGTALGLNYGTLIILRDITAENEVKQTSKAFVAQISHELKSPLNVIAMYSEMLQSISSEDEKTRIEATNAIQDEIERMSMLVNNLLNLNKIETGNFTPERTRIRLDELLQDVYENAAPRAKAAAIAFSLSMPNELPAVHIDKDMFRIALNNLISNALKYTKEGGTVRLEVAEHDQELVIAVRDTGIGLLEADQHKVFDKFYRTANGGEHTRSGHGLGLHLANQIVELHQGRISLESTIGVGSVFAIHIKKPNLNVQTDVL